MCSAQSRQPGRLNGSRRNRFTGTITVITAAVTIGAGAIITGTTATGAGITAIGIIAIGERQVRMNSDDGGLT